MNKAVLCYDDGINEMRKVCGLGTVVTDANGEFNIVLRELVGPDGKRFDQKFKSFPPDTPIPPDGITYIWIGIYDADGVEVLQNPYPARPSYCNTCNRRSSPPSGHVYPVGDTRV